MKIGICTTRCGFTGFGLRRIASSFGTRACSSSTVSIPKGLPAMRGETELIHGGERPVGRIHAETLHAVQSRRTGLTQPLPVYG